MTAAVRSRTSYLGLALLNFNFPNWGDDANKNTSILDTAFSILGITIDGAWANSTAYIPGTLVVDTDESLLYQCQIAHTSAATGTFAADRVANPTYWEEVDDRITSRGAWQTATAYHPGEFVSDAARFGVVLNNFTSTTSYDDDVTDGNIETVIDASAYGTLPETITASQYLRGNAGGTAYEFRSAAQVLSDIGGVAGPGSAVADQLVLFDGTTGKLVKAGSTLAQVLANTALTGNPTATTQSQADDSTKIATTAYVRAAITAILNGVSASFDTLAEIATALAGKLTTTNNLSELTASASTVRTNLGLVIGTDVEARDADILKANLTDVLQVGYTSGLDDDGTLSSTYKPVPTTMNFKKAAYNSAVEIQAPDTADNYVIYVLLTNGASAGTMTFSGFTFRTGDEHDTTNGRKFLLMFVKIDTTTILQILKLAS